MTALDHPARHADGPEQPPERVPFPVVDEVSRHCLQEEEPETVHIEVHLPGTPDPARLKAAFAEALRRHPRILMREARGPWYRRRYEWELTAEPDVEVVTFPPAERDALKKARTRSLSQAPPLSASPPIRLEVIAAEDASGTVASGAVGAATSQNGHANAALGGAAGRGPAPGREGTVAPGSADADARSDEGASRGGAPATPGDEGAGATNSAPPVTGGTPTPNGGESTAGSGASISPGDAPTTGTTATGAAPTPNGGDATAGSGEGSGPGDAPTTGTTATPGDGRTDPTVAAAAPNSGETTAGSDDGISPGGTPTTGTTAAGAAPAPHGGDATAGSGVGVGPGDALANGTTATPGDGGTDPTGAAPAPHGGDATARPGEGSGPGGSPAPAAPGNGPAVAGEAGAGGVGGPGAPGAPTRLGGSPLAGAGVGAPGAGPAPSSSGRPASEKRPASSGSVLFLTINHTALDGPACLRVLATAAELYGGQDNSPAAPPLRTPAPSAAAPESDAEAAGDAPGGWAPPARVSRGTPEPSPGNGMLVAELAVPRRPKGAPFTVNDQLMVATALMIAHWNREHGARPKPFRITMPVDDRPRSMDMPIGNGTRLVEVPFTAAELTSEDWGPEDIGALLRRTAERTRALKALPRPQLGRGAALLTSPVLPVTLRAAVTRGLRRAAAPWTSTTLLSNIGRVPYPLDFGDAGRAHAVWFSAPARLPRGLTVTTAATAGRLHVALRWSKTLLSSGDGAHLRDLFEHYLHATEHTEEGTKR